MTKVWKRCIAPDRPPGPIELSRYGFNSHASSGIPSFGRWPVCITQKDLVAGDVDVAVLGVPLDMSTGHKGSALGPLALRTAERYLVGGPLTRELTPFGRLVCVDYGDSNVYPTSIKATHKEVRRLVREIAETGAIPITLGGDHSIMRPTVQAITDVYGIGKVGVFQFDAHHDAWQDTIINHGTPVRNLIEKGFVSGEMFTQVGLRGYFPHKFDINWMGAQGVQSYYMADIQKLGMDSVMESAIRQAKKFDFLYVTFDIDCLDPTYAPGTGTPEPNGLTTREAFQAIKQLCAECRVVGFELVEVAPMLDPGYTTALNGLRIIQEAIAGIALKRAGETSYEK